MTAEERIMGRLRNILSYINPLTVEPGSMMTITIASEAIGLGLIYLGTKGNDGINTGIGATLLATGLWCSYMDNRTRR